MLAGTNIWLVTQSEAMKFSWIFTFLSAFPSGFLQCLCGKKDLRIRSNFDIQGSFASYLVFLAAQYVNISLRGIVPRHFLSKGDIAFAGTQTDISGERNCIPLLQSNDVGVVEDDAGLR